MFLSRFVSVSPSDFLSTLKQSLASGTVLVILPKSYKSFLNRTPIMQWRIINLDFVFVFLLLLKHVFYIQEQNIRTICVTENGGQ